MNDFKYPSVERLTTWVGSSASLITHTILFVGCFVVAFIGYAPWDTVLLILTTIVSLEAIYLAIFIQMTINRQGKELHEVSEDVEGIQEDIEEISEDVGEIIEDVEELQEDVEEMSDDLDLESGKPRTAESVTIESLTTDVKRILVALESLQKK